MFKNLKSNSMLQKESFHINAVILNVVHLEF